MGQMCVLYLEYRNVVWNRTMLH